MSGSKTKIKDDADRVVYQKLDDSRLNSSDFKLHDDYNDESIPSDELTAGPIEMCTGMTGELIPMITYWLPTIKPCLETMKTCQLDPKDFVICAYPKTGTHWMWETMMMLKEQKAEYQSQWKDSQWFDITPLDEIQRAIPSPRVLNTHLPLQHLPDRLRNGCKVVYIIRNPKDAMISSFHHLNLFLGEKAYKLGQYIRCFLYSKYNWWGSYFDHIATAWDNYKDDPNVYFLFYEDRKKSPVDSIKRLAEFMGVPASDQLVSDIIEATSFKNMKQGKHDTEVSLRERYGENASMYRKGEVSNWKNYLTVAQNEEVDRFIEEWNRERQIPFTF